MLSRIRKGNGLGFVYILVDDRRQEQQLYAFTSWDNAYRKAAELIMDEREALPGGVRQEIEQLFRQDRYAEVLHVWREGYGLQNGHYLRIEVLKLNPQSRATTHEDLA